MRTESGLAVSGYVFGAFTPATVSGEVYNDLDGSGTLATGDPGLQGWTVELINSSNQVVAYSTTDSNGDYDFSAVDPGTYTIAEINQSGFILTSPAAGTYTETVVGGQTVAGLDFGDFQTVSLGGEVYDDVNGNGTLATGDPGLQGWTVNLLNSLNQIVETSSTDGNGDYAFNGVGPGSYTIQEVLLSGYVPTSSPTSFAVTTSSGQVSTGYNFGNFELATVGGEVFNDLNDNGILDSGDPGLAGWTVNLVNSSSVVIDTTTTSENGDFSFTGVGPGTYTIQEVTQAGYVPTTPTSLTLTATSGLVSQANDFGQFEPPVVSGEVFNDLNGNGILDSGEPGLQGWTVNLLNSSDTVIATTTTNSNGDYSFTIATAGTFTIEEVPQAGYIQTAPASLSFTESLTSGQDVANLDFGDATTVSFSGEVYNDLNGDGMLESGEPGLAGWTVDLLNSSSSVVATTTTESDGDYSFTGILPGTYTMEEVSQNGYVQTAPASPGTYAETLTSGQSVANFDFGNFQTVTYSGEVYNDLNGDGTLESGEPGLQGWTVNLLNSSSTVIATTTTNSNGDYAFAGITPGSYTIEEVPLAGYLQTTTPIRFSETASSGQNVANLDFGDFQTITVSGEVYNDLNGDGTQEGGEPGLDDVTIDLLNGSNTVIATTTTNSSGSYTFTSVGPGQTSIRQVVPAGYIQTQPTAGGYPFTPTSGVNVAGRVFGDFETITVSGEVYDDLSGDGSQEGGEPGLAGVTIDLLNGSGAVIATTTTDGNGNYAFMGVGPGQTSVEQVVPAGYVQTQPTSGGYTFTTSSGANVSGDVFGDHYAPVLSPTITLGNGQWGYSETGLWTTGSGGFDGTYRTTGPAISSTYAQWRLPVAAGTYDVWVTWVASSSNADNAPYQVYDGASLKGTVHEDQKVAPFAGRYGGVYWVDLGSFTIDSGYAYVRLGANADGKVVANGVLLVPSVTMDMASVATPVRSPVVLGVAPSATVAAPTVVTPAPVTSARPTIVSVPGVSPARVVIAQKGIGNPTNIEPLSFLSQDSSAGQDGAEGALDDLFGLLAADVISAGKPKK